MNNTPFVYDAHNNDLLSKCRSVKPPLGGSIKPPLNTELGNSLCGVVRGNANLLTVENICNSEGGFLHHEITKGAFRIELFQEQLKNLTV